MFLIWKLYNFPIISPEIYLSISPEFPQIDCKTRAFGEIMGKKILDNHKKVLESFGWLN
jgi:hypothetical protein